MMAIEQSRLDEAKAKLGSLLDERQWQPDNLDTDGSALWRDEQQRVVDGELDDRRLYWRRLAIERLIGDDADALNTFEDASRGFDDLEFKGSADLRILVTGFDPFHLDTDITQSNPSGVAALRLHKHRIRCAIGTAEIRSAIVPVRFSDFDNGLIEGLVKPFFTDDSIDMVITISMGRDRFDLERFPGRRRSAETPDNCRVYCGGTSQAPVIAPGLEGPDLEGLGLEGPEFVEFSLPVAEMCRVKSDYSIADNREVETLERGLFEATGLEELLGQTAVQGSGGGYLSNEISYRVIRLAREMNLQIPLGHIHTPKLVGYEAETISRITDQTILLVESAIHVLAKTRVIEATK